MLKESKNSEESKTELSETKCGYQDDNPKNILGFKKMCHKIVHSKTYTLKEDFSLEDGSTKSGVDVEIIAEGWNDGSDELISLVLLEFVECCTILSTHKL